MFAFARSADCTGHDARQYVIFLIAPRGRRGLLRGRHRSLELFFQPTSLGGPSVDRPIVTTRGVILPFSLCNLPLLQGVATMLSRSRSAVFSILQPELSI